MTQQIRETIAGAIDQRTLDDGNTLFPLTFGRAKLTSGNSEHFYQEGW